MADELTPALAESFAKIALGHVSREYPNSLAHMFDSAADAATPSQLHPIFYGSLDWHSCVHGYWMLARLMNRFPDLPSASRIVALFDAQLTADKVAGECAYFERPSSRGYERPYGWGWLLKLASELSAVRDIRWFETLKPLADIIAGRFTDFLPIATYPIRVGTHFNTAFALRLAADYADSVADGELTALLTATAERWYGGDAACPAWGEPSGDEFLSSALIEAECMRRLMTPDAFRPWFERFLPDIEGGRPGNLFVPATVTDRSDGKIAHLDGLNISRAWCWRALASSLAEHDPRHGMMIDAADRHLAAGLGHVDSDYMGEHWLASFAVLALEA
ncbi:DUF2891 domain-containing protein [Rhizobium halophytocola]|uniref:DUF2891 domain-containing protein n=1 Tax=Rhizobium halophytocola TaxID=735519 RepID=A0ABS4DYD9_9HYPH|nr:DUF2891 domain-containing protein [Rhizobium halophytocola]MBP1850709.1 hypothetical protein [Rhizobium halophytocola]